MQIGHTSNVFPRCTCSSTRSTQPLWISTKRWRCSPTSQWLMSRSSTLTTGEVFIYFWSRSLTVFGMQSCKHHRGHGDCQQGFGSVQRGGGKVPQVGRNIFFKLFNGNKWFSLVRCVETYALYAQVLNDQQVFFYLWPLPGKDHTSWALWVCVQEFDRADALYQQGMKVDPGNANLLVGHLE